MTQEKCQVHENEDASNGCRICRCGQCGLPRLNHDIYVCLTEQVRIYRKLYQIIEDASRASTPLIRKVLSSQPYSQTGIQIFCKMALDELIETQMEAISPTQKESK